MEIHRRLNFGLKILLSLLLAFLVLGTLPSYGANEKAELRETLERIKLPNVEWRDESLHDALEFLKLKIDALRQQGLAIPPLSYTIDKNSNRRVTYLAKDVSLGEVFAFLNSLKGVSLKIASEQVHVTVRDKNANR